MNYAGITKSSFINGDGRRAALWLSGCSHHCNGCHNPELQNPEYGQDVTTGTLEELIKLLRKPHIDGLTLSGGDPMFPGNRKELELICHFLKHEVPDKTIWMYTGYQLIDIILEPILEYLNVIVDGEFIEKYRDERYKWAGSTNQRIWRKTNGLWRNSNDA